jgi:glycosyltransferase involved in cell wall biosynthesis
MLAKKNQKLIVSLMGSELYDPTSKFNQFSVLKYIASKLNLFFCKYFYDMTIVKSNRMKEKLLRNTTCVVIPNGVDFKLFYPKERTRISTIKAKADEKLVLSVVFKESKIKNLDLLRDSMKYLHTENVRLIIATNLKQHELLDYYNRADVFVLTSFYEGSPNVIKEAMACNCPIVSTDVGDVKNLISSTKGCYICAFDSKDVAAKIDLALSFNARTNGREQIKHLELNQISNQIISVYVQV